ncbi:MAG: hypothetical protein EBR82_56820 [Caulobacteraceae bacterium]|nr:hypothetical protein [Caulobacteraceae bacterium]
MSQKTRRDYRDAANRRLPGVTTILGNLSKPELFGWYAKTAAEAAADAVMRGLPVTEAVTVGAAAPNARRDAAADAGTLAHNFVEAHFADEPVLADLSDETQAKAHGAYRRIVDHLEKTGCRVLRSECVLVDTVAGYGGTIDLVVERDGWRFIVDIKTGKRAYNDVIAQLGAYRTLWLHHWPDQPIAGGFVIHAPLDGDVVEIPITNDQLDIGAGIFGACLVIHKARPSMRLEASNG